MNEASGQEKAKLQAQIDELRISDQKEITELKKGNQKN